MTKIILNSSIDLSSQKKKENKFRKSYLKDIKFNSKCHARFKANEKITY